MTKKEIQVLAQQFINGYLSRNTRYNWQFKFNNRKSSLGICKVNRYTLEASIELSRHMIGMKRKDIKETLLHEIAHGIDHERNGYSSHGYNWQKIMRELGQEPERLASREKSIAFSENIIPKYSGNCPVCNKEYKRNRISSYVVNNNLLDKSYYCIKCNKDKKRDEIIFINYKQNY